VSLVSWNNCVSMDGKTTRVRVGYRCPRHDINALLESVSEL